MECETAIVVEEGTPEIVIPKKIRKMIDKVKNFKQFVNENVDNSITSHINQLKKEYLDKYGIDACDINKSECHNFAEALENI